jgi:SNF2 family DNA or RNA helicase
MDEIAKLAKALAKVKIPEKKKVEPLSAQDAVDAVIKECKSTLRPYQLKVIKHMATHDELLMVHGTGMGKTLSALGSAQVYIKMFPDHKVIVISPASVTGNFNKEKEEKYDLDDSGLSDHYSFYSFKAFSGLKYAEIDFSKVFLIIDECHNIRNSTTKGYKNLMSIIPNVHKILLMTATPFVNYLGDFIPICDFLHRGTVSSAKGSKFRLTAKPTWGTSGYYNNLEKMEMMLKDKVSYEFNDEYEQNPDFPKINIHKVKSEMSPEYYKSYLISLLKNMVFGESPEAFYHGYRRVVNDAGIDKYYSIKTMSVLDILLEKKKDQDSKESVGKESENKESHTSQAFDFYDPLGCFEDQEDRKKESEEESEEESELEKKKKGSKAPKKIVKQTLIFTNWLDYGVGVITSMLDKENISHDIITGQVKSSTRMEIVKRYNRKRFNVLIITKAGCEGLDLKGTRNVIILDPVWNESGIEQIIGRGCRYKSHEHLDPKERFLDVYKMIIVAPKDHTEIELDVIGKVLEDYKTGDEILYSIIKRKVKINKDVKDLLKSSSI